MSISLVEKRLRRIGHGRNRGYGRRSINKSVLGDMLNIITSAEIFGTWDPTRWSEVRLLSRAIKLHHQDTERAWEITENCFVMCLEFLITRKRSMECLVFILQWADITHNISRIRNSAYISDDDFGLAVASLRELINNANRNSSGDVLLIAFLNQFSNLLDRALYDIEGNEPSAFAAYVNSAKLFIRLVSVFTTHSGVADDIKIFVTHNNENLELYNYEDC